MIEKLREGFKKWTKRIALISLCVFVGGWIGILVNPNPYQEEMDKLTIQLDELTEEQLIVSAYYNEIRETHDSISYDKEILHSELNAQKENYAEQLKADVEAIYETKIAYQRRLEALRSELEN